MPIRLVLVTCLAGLAAPAFAQPEATPPTPARITTHVFSADTVEGTVIGPDGVAEVVRRAQRHSSLIRVRADFRDRLAASAEDI